MLKLNETPVRTSRNFNINNIKIDDIEMPKGIKEFYNIDIIKESEDLTVNEDIQSLDLTYGLCDELDRMGNQDSNCKLKLEINDKNKKTNRIIFSFDEENKVLIENIEIVANENSKSNIIIDYESDENGEFFHNGILFYFIFNLNKIFNFK